MWGRLQAVAITGATSEGLMLAALPLLAVSITVDPREVALVNVVGQAPWLLCSLFAGLLIDRVRRETVLRFAYIGLTCAALILAVATSIGLLTLPLLVVVAFAVTSAQVLGDGASGALVPEIVPKDQLPAANTRLQVIDRGLVQFVVPPATGALMTLAPGVPVWAACVAALAAFVLTRGIRAASDAPVGTYSLRDMAAGVKHLLATPLLRSITITVALGSFASGAANTMLVLYATQELHLGPVGYGVLLACMAVGWVASSFIVGWIVARLGYSMSMRIAQTATAVVLLLIAGAPPWAPAVGALLALMTAVTLVWNVCSQSSRQLHTPSRLLGRVLTSHRALAWGLTPLGALAGGLVAAELGLREVWVMSSAFQAVGAVIVWCTLSPAAFARTAMSLDSAHTRQDAAE
nr:MFS transporter [Actinokineospora iranica]